MKLNVTIQSQSEGRKTLNSVFDEGITTGYSPETRKLLGLGSRRARTVGTSRSRSSRGSRRTSLAQILPMLTPLLLNWSESYLGGLMPPEIDLLAFNRGSIAASAGCGKTQLIADTICAHTEAKPILVLTHTNAGVSALRARLQRAGVPRVRRNSRSGPWEAAAASRARDTPAHR